jgi:mono/diheme cytochrome c family protein
MRLHGIALAALLALQAGAAAAEEKASPGKALFLANKCMACHTISTEGVEKSKAADAEAAAEGKSGEGASKKGPPDLSGVGLRHDAAWLGKYLLKLEAKDGKKHLKKFRGTDEELGVLSAWLASLKKEAAKKAPPAEEKEPDAAPSEKEGEKKTPPTPEGDTSKS